MELSEFCGRLDDRLSHGEYADIDASPNGLQVGRADDRVLGHVAFAVDGVEATVAAAADAGADLLVVHHGMVWGGLDRVTGHEYDRVAALVEADLPLYVSHLPLDGHAELGNAAGLAEFLDCEVTDPFGDCGGVYIGQRARAAEPYTVAGLRDRLSALNTGGRPVDVLDFGPDRIENVGIVTGGGADWSARRPRPASTLSSPARASRRYTTRPARQS